jgi:methyl-accepting chemotaxis protein
MKNLRILTVLKKWLSRGFGFFPNNRVSSRLSFAQKGIFQGIQGRLLTWFLILSLLPAAVISTVNYQISLSNLKEASSQNLKHVITGALSTANAYDRNVKMGVFGSEFAQEGYRDNMNGYKQMDGTRDRSRSNFDLGENYRFFAFDEKGTLTMDPFQEGKDFSSFTNSDGVHVFEEMKAVGSGTLEFKWANKTGENEVKQLAYVTNFAPWNWTIGVTVNESAYLAAVNSILFNNILIFFITAAVVFGISLFIAKQFLRPILRVRDTLEEVRQGNLTARVEVKGKDELAELGQHLNDSLDSVSTAIREVIDASQQVAASSQQMTANIEQSYSAVERVHHNVQAISSSSHELNNSSQDISSVVQQLVASIEQVTATTTEVVGSTESMEKSSETGLQMIRQIQSQMSEIEDVVGQSADKVNSLMISSEQIAKMSSAIASIAGQTNLLALNAAIEAARAGEAGKGFAVVASEVRKLAEQSGSAAKQIDQIIRTIRSEVQDSVESMGKGKESVQEGSKLVHETGEAFDHILNIVKTVALQVKETSVAMSEMATGTNSTVTSVSSIVDTAEANNERAELTLEATQEQTNSMQQIQQSSSELAKLAEKLSETVGQFKV